MEGVRYFVVRQANWQKVLNDPERYSAALEKADISTSKVWGVASRAGVSHRKNDCGRRDFGI